MGQRVCDIGPGTTDARDAQFILLLQCKVKRNELSPNSLANFVSTLNTLREVSKGTSATRAIVVDPWKLWSAIVAKWTNVETRRNKVANIVSFLRYDQDLGTIATRTYWNKSLKLVHAPAAEVRANNVLTKEKKETIPSLKKLHKAALRLEHRAGDTRISSLEHLWLMVAARVKAKRADWGALLCIKHKKDISDKSRNFIILPKEGVATLVLREFKGSRYKPDFEEDLPDDVTKALRQSLCDYPREYMFETINASGFKGYTKWSDSSFARWAGKTMTKHLGAGHITINGLRAAYAMEYTASGLKVTTAQKDAVAKSMMHSRNVQQTRYIKVVE